jgi:hypothetical protein
MVRVKNNNNNFLHKIMLHKWGYDDVPLGSIVK